MKVCMCRKLLISSPINTWFSNRWFRLDSRDSIQCCTPCQGKLLEAQKCSQVCRKKVVNYCIFMDDKISAKLVNIFIAFSMDHQTFGQISQSIFFFIAFSWIIKFPPNVGGKETLIKDSMGDCVMKSNSARNWKVQSKRPSYLSVKQLRVFRCFRNHLTASSA